MARINARVIPVKRSSPLLSHPVTVEAVTDGPEAACRTPCAWPVTPSLIAEPTTGRTSTIAWRGRSAEKLQPLNTRAAFR